MMSKSLSKIFSAAAVFSFMVLICVNLAYSQAEREQSPIDKTAQGQESDQQISDFSLAGFNDQGKKSWDLAGKSADIFDNVVKLKDVKGNLYGASENVKLKADRGDFDKKEGKVHLEKDVVITTSSGAKLTTNSLDWDRKNQIVNTKERVNIEKETLVATATGATGHPNLSKVSLEKDVQVEVSPAKTEEQKGKSGKTIITCDGPLEIDYDKNIATFKNNVKVDNQDALMYSDTMDVYFAKSEKVKDAGTPVADVKATNAKVADAKAADVKATDAKAVDAKSSSPLTNSKIEKIFARGNVKIVKGENVSYSEEATYTGADKKIVLTGKPRLILSSTEDLKGVLATDNK